MRCLCVKNGMQYEVMHCAICYLCYQIYSRLRSMWKFYRFVSIFFLSSSSLFFQVKCNKNQNDRKIVIIIVSEPHTQKHNTRIENLSATMMGWEKNVTNYKSSIIFRFLLPLTTIDAWSNQFIHNILSMRFLFFTFILFALN